MNRLIVLGITAFMLASSLSRAGDKSQPGELQALLEQNARLEESLTKGDAKAFANLHTRDFDLLGVGGTMLVGRDQFEKRFDLDLKSRPAEFKSEHALTAFRFLKADVVLRTQVRHVSGLPGSRSRVDYHATILVKEGDKWRIAAARHMIPYTKDRKTLDRFDVPRGTTDEAALTVARERSRAYCAAINKKDHDAHRAMLHPAIKRQLFTGISFEGRDTSLRQFTENPKATGQLEMKVGSARFFGKDRAVLIYDGAWEFTIKEPTGPTKGIFSSIVVKEKDNWQTIFTQTMIPIALAAPTKKPEE